MAKIKTTVKYQYKGKTKLSPKEFIAPFQKGFSRTESDDWAKKKGGIDSKPHVVVLQPDFMRDEKDGKTVLTRPDITKDELMAVAQKAVVNWRPVGKLQKAIKEYNLKQFKRTKHNDYVIVYNFNHSRALFDKLKTAGLVRGAGFTDRGHTTAKTRYHAESEVDKLPDFPKWGAGSHKGAYLATRGLKKTLVEESSLLTPFITHEWLVRVNREVSKIAGMEQFLIIVPEAAWKNRSKKEERELKSTYKRLIKAWLDSLDADDILSIAHSKTTEQLLSDKITDLLVGKKVAAYNKKGSKKHKGKKRKIALGTLAIAKPPPLRTSGGKFTSAMNIQAILDNRIKEEVADNMGKGGALVYRTGRFAESVSVTKVMQSRQGALTAFYTYMKAPYQTFERGYAQGSLRRDPRKLIAASIREIARETLNHKLQIRTRRV